MPIPKISVCIPVYNVEPYLQQCLDSIINQTFTNFEIIIVNDASHDNSETIIQKYLKKDSRIRYFKHQTNQGLPATRKTAIENSQADYLSFVDSDDWVENNFLEELYSAAKYKNADVTICNYMNWFDKDLSIIELNFKKTPNTTWFDWHLEDYRLSPGYCNKLWKKELFDEPNIDFPNIFFGEDMIVTTKLLYYAKKIVIVDQPLYHYRTYKPKLVDKKLIEKKCLKRLQDELILHQNLIDFFSQHNMKDEIYTSLFNRRHNLVTHASNTIICKNKTIKILLLQLIKTYFNHPPYVISPTKVFLYAYIGLITRKIIPPKLFRIFKDLIFVKLTRKLL